MKQHCSLFHFEAKNKVGLEQNLLQNEAKSEKKKNGIGGDLKIYHNSCF